MIGYGFTVQVNDGASSAYVALASVRKIKVNGEELGKADATVLTSSGRRKEYEAAMIEPVTMEVTQLYSPSEYARLLDLGYATHGWKVIAVDTAEGGFNGFVTKVDLAEITPEGEQEMMLSVQGTGAYTFTEAD